MTKVLNLLGLARRAGKLVTGEELVIKAVQEKSCALVFLASDASENLKKKLTDKTTSYGVTLRLDYTADELSQAIGTNRKVLAVCDLGFAKTMMENLPHALS
ncbi:MAG: YlxQ-related RNA-binding protein [Streptococcaceae bacterium]|jgi:ribosomal protein L7Ae-like RNA K-turn-binding protein|nr:YlxQ-related RNA-binding protein [Streptococcaceae bacterium]